MKLDIDNTMRKLASGMKPLNGLEYVTGPSMARNSRAIRSGPIGEFIEVFRLLHLDLESELRRNMRR